MAFAFPTTLRSDIHGAGVQDADGDEHAFVLQQFTASDDAVAELRTLRQVPSAQHLDNDALDDALAPLEEAAEQQQAQTAVVAPRPAEQRVQVLWDTQQRNAAEQQAIMEAGRIEEHLQHGIGGSAVPRVLAGVNPADPNPRLPSAMSPTPSFRPANRVHNGMHGAPVDDHNVRASNIVQRPTFRLARPLVPTEHPHPAATATAVGRRPPTLLPQDAVKLLGRRVTDVLQGFRDHGRRVAAVTLRDGDGRTGRGVYVPRGVAAELDASAERRGAAPVQLTPADALRLMARVHLPLADARVALDAATQSGAPHEVGATEAARVHAARIAQRRGAVPLTTNTTSMLASADGSATRSGRFHVRATDATAAHIQALAAAQTRRVGDAQRPQPHDAHQGIGYVGGGPVPRAAASVARGRSTQLAQHAARAGRSAMMAAQHGHAAAKAHLRTRNGGIAPRQLRPVDNTTIRHHGVTDAAPHVPSAPRARSIHAFQPPPPASNAVRGRAPAFVPPMQGDDAVRRVSGRAPRNTHAITRLQDAVTQGVMTEVAPMYGDQRHPNATYATRDRFRGTHRIATDGVVVDHAVAPEGQGGPSVRVRRAQFPSTTFHGTGDTPGGAESRRVRNVPMDLCATSNSGWGEDDNGVRAAARHAAVRSPTAWAAQSRLNATAVQTEGRWVDHGRPRGAESPTEGWASP